MEYDEDAAKEAPSVCRCCLTEGYFNDFRVLGCSYPHSGDIEDYDKMLVETLNISISQHVHGPNSPNRLICEVCITRLRDSCIFKKQVLDSEKAFIDMLHQRDFRAKATVAAEEAMKSEPEPETHDADGFGHYSDKSDEDMPLMALQGLQRSGASPPQSLHATASPPRRQQRPKGLRSTLKTKTSRAQENRPTQLRRRNLEKLFNNTSVIPFKWRGNYLCFYCGKTVEEYADLREHTLAHGNCNYRHYAIKSVRSGDAEVKIDVSYITCRLCNESFSDLNEVIAHLNWHGVEYDTKVSANFTKYRLLDLACVECGEAATSFKKLVGHVNKNHPANVFVCESCSKSFSKKRDLLAHSRTYHKSGGYSCDECNVIFETLTKMRAHKESSHPHVCPICFLTFPALDRKRIHMNEVHLKDGVSQCQFCQTSWNTRQAFLQHLRRCKARKSASNSESTRVKVEKSQYKEVDAIRQNVACILNMSNALPFKFYLSTFRCFYCPTNFTDSDQLRAHTNQEHPVCDVKHNSMRMRARQDVDFKIDIANLACKVCLDSVENLDALVEHLVSKHQANYDTTTNVNLLPFKLIKDKYPCLLCDRRDDFKFFVNLLKHVNEAHSNNKVICVYCGEAFRSKNNMRSHIQKHHAPPKIECQECGLAFHTGSKLAAHASRIHGKNVFKCNKCPENFPTPYLKRRHMMYAHNIGCKCPHCSKMFTGNAIMQAHLRRTHLKEKTVECPVCHLKMFDVHMMKIHMVRHDGERNFHCDVCGKKFMWKKNLSNHMSVHAKGMCPALYRKSV